MDHLALSTGVKQSLLPGQAFYLNWIELVRSHVLKVFATRVSSLFLSKFNTLTLSILPDHCGLHYCTCTIVYSISVLIICWRYFYEDNIMIPSQLFRQSRTSTISNPIFYTIAFLTEKGNTDLLIPLLVMC